MSAGSMGEQNKGMGMAERKSFVVLTGLLFSFWVIISGILEVKYLAIGLISSLITAWICRPLLYLGAPGDREYLAYDFSIPRYLAFWPWLLWEIVKANIHIAMIVLHPRLPIQPHVFTFRKKMNNPTAHLTLANSITLTPGTVTIDHEGDLYTIHALTLDAEEDLVPEKGEGEMQARVAAVFGEEENLDHGSGDE
ncbi:MAG: cation transporter [Clostridia bacterium]|nr:cation transporter [Clostridia bacterium]